MVFPLIPHYAQSSTQTACDEVKAIYNSKQYPFKIKIIEPYYNHPAFISALATGAKPYLTNHFDRLVFSYHSLPTDQVRKAWRKGKSSTMYINLKRQTNYFATNWVYPPIKHCYFTHHNEAIVGCVLF